MLRRGSTGRFRVGRENLASILRSFATNVSARCTEAVSFEKCTHGPTAGAGGKMKGPFPRAFSFSPEASAESVHAMFTAGAKLDR